jgi:hypothetical protein
VGIVAVLALSVRRAAKLFGREGTWFREALVLYEFWLLPAITLAIFLSDAMAGVSMAVVDGAATGRVLWVAEAKMALQMILFGHVIIIPWVSAAVWFLRRCQEKTQCF